MVYQSLTDANITTISGLFVYISNQVPVFFPFLFLTLFLILTVGSFYSSLRIRGYASIWASASVGGFVITVLSLILSFIPNVINKSIILISFAVTLVSLIMFFVTSKSD